MGGIKLNIMKIVRRLSTLCILIGVFWKKVMASLCILTVVWVTIGCATVQNDNTARQSALYMSASSNLSEMSEATETSTVKPILSSVEKENAVEKVKPTLTPNLTQSPKPVPAEQVSVKLISVTSPAARNSYATLKAKMVIGCTASIEVDYKSGPSKAQGLESKKADANGNVSWTWRVGGRTTLGFWPITVSCNGESVVTEFEVVR